MGRLDVHPPLPGRLDAQPRRGWSVALLCTLVLSLCLAGLTKLTRRGWLLSPILDSITATSPSQQLPYGTLPLADDPFKFIPCTSATVLPPLEDAHPSASWAKLFDPNPAHWSWGAPSGQGSEDSSNIDYNNVKNDNDPYAGRGIYLCGYLDVPLDYINQSDNRITRLAVTKFQVSGLARISSYDYKGVRNPNSGKKSERTIVIEPGGPGGSGVSYAWETAEKVSKRFSDGRYDVLGWDPRGVNASLPTASCFPHNADRDRWRMLMSQHRAVNSAAPLAHLQLVDAFNDATFGACWERLGDLPRFISTASVARDVEEIRKALGEPDLTGYFVSYGTGIGQTFANIFPESVGRLILDGTEYVRDHRLLGGFGWTALDNGTDAWHDGFLGECVKAGPEYCALARPRQGAAVTLQTLNARMKTLLKGLIDKPIPAYSESAGPSLITYSSLVDQLYESMYDAKKWRATAQMLYDLELGNSSLANAFLNGWEYDPTLPCPARSKPSTDEVTFLVICADAYDAPQPDGLDWWLDLWANMTEKSWIAGNPRFYDVFPCRHFSKYWPKPAEVYRGDLNHTLKSPVLLIAETYDPATPLRNGRRLAREMGHNARLIVHHGYGHATRDPSDCTEAIAREYIQSGTIPDVQETACYANQKPYFYDAKASGIVVVPSVAYGPN